MPTIIPNVTTDRRPSPGLWQHCSQPDDPDNWVGFFEDFISNDETAGTGPNLSLVIANGGDIVHDPTQLGGVVRLATAGDTDDEATLVTGDNIGAFCEFTVGLKAFYEVRFAVDLLVYHSFFFGFAEEALGGAMFTTSDALEDKDYVGWQILTADGDVAEPCYNTASGTAVVVKADAVTLVAEEYLKLGIGFWDDRTTWFYNGVAIANCDVAHPVKYSTSGFPDGEPFAAYAAVAEPPSAAADSGCDIDWIKVYAQVTA